VTAWLLKTEPDEFSFDDLLKRGVEPWDGISNSFALRNLTQVQVGEPCVIYHTGKERQAVGLASVVRTAYPDPNKSDPKLVVIDVKAGARLEQPVPLGVLKANPAFADSLLVRQGRLSVVPLSDVQYATILELSGAQPGSGK
jgi:predicted RNA-binding protein with PUA-like domain